MTHLTSPLPIPARSTRWSCFLLAAAALQLSACGGDNNPAQPLAAPDVGGAAPGLVAPGPAPTRAAPHNACDTQPNDTAEQLLECVTLAGVRAHQAALADIAQANAGTRLAGTPGFDASLAYAKKVLTEAGYSVSVQPFEFPVSRVETSILRAPGQLASQSLPHRVPDYAGSAEVTAAANPPSGPEGCTAADYAGFARGDIALLRRGGCDLEDKVAAAEHAGAAGAVIYSLDNLPPAGNLSADSPQHFPVVLVSQDVGRDLLKRPPGGRTLHLQTRTSRSMATTYNLLAESTSGDPAHVTMVGAHLDSVRAGGGSNDNGSGVAAVLETARQMARVKPLNQLRFALWGAEEQGLLGSRHYVRNLDEAARAKLGLYLNFDMIGSPNPVYYVYGGDGSAGSQAISSPKASARIVNTFSDFYTARKLASKPMNSGGRSDHKPFADIGVPFGGIFTGAEGTKTQQEADTWGGTAGKPLDPCYHRACDNLENTNEPALDVNADAVAHTVLFFAMNRLER
ncbi:MAG: M28 family peptidase [Comamonas sp.]